MPVHLVPRRARRIIPAVIVTTARAAALAAILAGALAAVLMAGPAVPAMAADT